MGSPQNPPPELELLGTILGATLPVDCLRGANPTDAAPALALDVPLHTALHPNVPNPFNQSFTRKMLVMK